MAQNIDDLVAKLSHYDFVKCTLSDLSGSARGKVCPSKEAAKIMKNGMPIFAGVVGMQGSSVVSFQEVVNINYADAIWTPDPTTLHPVSWLNQPGKPRVAQVYGALHWQDGSEQEACPRQSAIRQLRRLQERGWRLYSGSEMEFIIYDKESQKPAGDRPLYCYQRAMTEFQEPLFEFSQVMDELGYSVGTMYSEYSTGQIELALNPAPGIKSADCVFTAKTVLYDVLGKYNLTPCFMTKTNMTGASSGAHFSHSLWASSGKNVFYDPASDDGLSDVARHWIAGLLKHSSSLVAMVCPTVNCYRRLHTSWAPDVSNWGVGNRMATIRTKKGGAHGTYIENRIPSMNSNPYLVLAATIAAGLDGVDNKLECPQQNQADATSLPGKLSVALEALENDTAFKEAVGPQLVNWFVQMKKEVDIKKFECHTANIDTEEEIKKEFEEYSQYI